MDPRNYVFDEKREVSTNTANSLAQSELTVLFFPNQIGATPGTKTEDKAGMDWRVTLQDGSTISIDFKTRARGCSRHWKHWDESGAVEEFPLEDWSVMPENGKAGRLGWAKDSTKRCDFFCFYWDRVDSDAAYIFSAKKLRMTFAQHEATWLANCEHQRQRSNGGEWYSHCVFVPRSIFVPAFLDMHKCTGMLRASRTLTGNSLGGF